MCVQTQTGSLCGPNMTSGQVMKFQLYDTAFYYNVQTPKHRYWVIYLCTHLPHRNSTCRLWSLCWSLTRGSMCLWELTFYGVPAGSEVWTDVSQQKRTVEILYIIPIHLQLKICSTDPGTWIFQPILNSSMRLPFLDLKKSWYNKYACIYTKGKCKTCII